MIKENLEPTVFVPSNKSGPLMTCKLDFLFWSLFVMIDLISTFVLFFRCLFALLVTSFILVLFPGRYLITVAIFAVFTGNSGFQQGVADA